jgi:hypothetical protein
MWLGLLRDLGICGLFAFILWAPLGRVVLVRLIGRANSSGFGVSLALGMGFWGLWTLLLGLLGILYPAVLASSALLVFAVFRLDRHLGIVSGTPGRDRRELPALAAFALLSACYIAIALGGAAAPELAFDALNVHLPYARDAAASHRAGFAPNNWSSVMPALPLMSYINGFLFSGLTLVKLVNVLVFVAGGLLIYSYLSRWWGKLRGIAGAALFWSCPVAVYEATTALIDLPLTLYSALAVFSLLEWTRTKAEGDLRLSAVTLGLAFGCKYHSAFWVLPLLVIIVWEILAVRRRSVIEAMRTAAVYGLLAFAFFVPWAVRAWWYTGNPVFPAANSIFRSAYFPPSMESAAAAAYANEGVGRGVRALIALPWTVTFHPGPFRGTLGLIFLPGVALAVMRFRVREIGYGLLAAAAYFAAWALTAQEIRYLLPLLPLVSFLTVGGFLGTSPGAAPTRVARIIRAVCIALLIAAAAAALPPVYPLWAREWTYWHSYKSPVAYLTGRESAAEYVLRDVPSAYVYEYINRNLTPGDRILLLNDSAQFYSSVPTLYSFTVEADRILMDTTEEGVIGKMRESGLTHVLLNYNGIAPLPGVTPRLGVYFFLDGKFRERCMEPVFSRNNVTLYRFRCR